MSARGASKASHLGPSLLASQAPYLNPKIFAELSILARHIADSGKLNPNYHSTLAGMMLGSQGCGGLVRELGGSSFRGACPLHTRVQPRRSGERRLTIRCDNDAPLPPAGTSQDVCLAKDVALTMQQNTRLVDNRSTVAFIDCRAAKRVKGPKGDAGGSKGGSGGGGGGGGSGGGGGGYKSPGKVKEGYVAPSLVLPP